VFSDSLGKLHVSVLAAFTLSWCGASLCAGQVNVQLRQEVLTTWTTDQGLPQSFITAIAQTKDGFVWIGTMGGLAQYLGDGNWAAARSAISAKVIVNRSDADSPGRSHGRD
jgi:hypothetical protein